MAWLSLKIGHFTGWSGLARGSEAGVDAPPRPALEEF
jgi:hypothetical protein